VQESGDYRESWQPQAMSSAAIKASQDIAFKITNEIAGLGLFGVELFIKGDNVWFSEVSPRPHDTGMVTMVTQRQNEFELHARAILGLPVDTGMQSTGASAVILGGLDAQGVIYEGLDKALSVPTSEVRLFGKPEAFTNRRMGVALATAETVDEARNRAVKAATMIVIKPDR
jgi:phosphoribosylglycinamide formyltransferase 2